MSAPGAAAIPSLGTEAPERGIAVRSGWSRAAAVLAIGGALVMLGAALPWLTLYGGLQRYSGLVGLYGRMLFGAGAVTFAIGAATMRSRPIWRHASALALGAVLVLFVSWLLMGLREVLVRRASPMLVPHAGPGLLVALAGALVIAASALVDR